MSHSSRSRCMQSWLVPHPGTSHAPPPVRRQCPLIRDAVRVCSPGDNRAEASRFTASPTPTRVLSLQQLSEFMSGAPTRRKAQWWNVCGVRMRASCIHASCGLRIFGCSAFTPANVGQSSFRYSSHAPPGRVSVCAALVDGRVATAWAVPFPASAPSSSTALPLRHT